MQKQVFYLRSQQIRQNLKNFIDSLPLNPDKPLAVTIQEPTRSLEQNARLHAMLSEISKKTTYLGKKRGVEFWKGLFVSGWQIATGQHPEIVPGLEGEFINIRESTAKLSVKKLSEVMEYIEAYCAMNKIMLTQGKNYD